MVERKTVGEKIFDVGNYIFMAIFFVLMVYPFWYIVTSSFSAVRPHGDLMLWPHGIDFSAYKQILSDNSLLQALFISVARCVIAPTLNVAICGMAAYATATPRLVFGKFIRTVFTISMYISAGMIPGFIFNKAYGLMNNFWVYVIPCLFSAYNMFLIRNYIYSIPRSMVEAVYVDGGNDFQAYWRVIFPICRPVNTCVLLFNILGTWNSYMDTTLFNATKPELHTLMYKLYAILSQTVSLESVATNGLAAANAAVSTAQVKMAITVIAIIPIMCVYPFLQKHFMSGIMIGGVKE